MNRLAVALIIGSLVAHGQISTASDARISAQIASYAILPLTFEPNQGQASPNTRFVSHGLGYSLLLDPGEVSFIFRSPNKKGQSSDSAMILSTSVDETRFGLRLEHADQGAAVNGLDPQPGKSNYFLGNNPAKWLSNVPHYKRVQMSEIYPGIDVVFYGSRQQLEYDFIVAPGASPDEIELRAEGADSVLLDASENLVIGLHGSQAVFQKPVVYQENNGQRQTVSGHYVLADGGNITFEIGPYDHSRALIIDPVLSYSLILGGSISPTTPGDPGTIAFGLAVDSQGNAYISGATCAVDFPSTSGTPHPAGGGPIGTPCDDAFITKLNPTGTALVYSTYLGGSNRDGAARIAIDGTGAAYVTGVTASSDFPTTSGAAQTTFGGGTCTFGFFTTPCSDAFVSKISADGSKLVYSTLLGGSQMDGGIAIAVDINGNAYVGGFTSSTNFPVTSSALQKTYGGGSFDGFVAKLNPTGTSLVYSTYLGGNAGDDVVGLAIDSLGATYVAGGTHSSNFPVTTGAFQTALASGARENAHVSKINSAGSALVYSTYLGGSQKDFATDLVVDGSGNAYVVGATSSSNFPVTSGAFQKTFGGDSGFGCANLELTCGDAFVTKINPTGTGLVFSTYLGGNQDDGAMSIVLDSTDNVWITGASGSSNFPFTADAYHKAAGAFVANLDSTGSKLLFSSGVGTGIGNGSDLGMGIALDKNGNIYAVGQQGDSPIFPVTPGAFQSICQTINPTAFAVKFAPGSGRSGVQLSTQSLTFPLPGNIIASQSVGSTSPPQMVTVTNNGNAALDLALSFGRSGQLCTPLGFTETDDCGSSIAPSASCNINVSYSPLTPTSVGTNLIIQDNAPDGPHLVSLQGTVGVPELLISPSPENFGGVPLGQSSSGGGVQLKDINFVPFSVSSATITGTNAGDFTIVGNTCSSTTTSCFISVSLKPSASGTRTATLNIADTTPGSPHHVTLTGTGTSGPIVAPLFAPLFSAQAVGTTSAAQTVTVQNVGSSTLHVSGVTVSGDYIISNGCTSGVAPNNTCQISVSFKPTAPGTRTGTLTITDDAFDSPQSVPLSGSGTNGTSPILQVTPNGGAPGNSVFGNTSIGLSNLGGFNVNNIGSGTLSLSSAVASGDFSASMNGSACSSISSSFSACSINVTFTPTAAGVRNSTLTITSNAPGSPQSFPLTGTGVLAPVASISPPSVSFGDQDISTTSTPRAVTVTNTGGSSLAVSSIHTTAGFLQSSNCGTVAAGAHCTIMVSYAPTVNGSSSGTLTINDNAVGRSQSIGLYGNGISGTPAASLYPNSLTFATQTVGTTSPSQAITLSSSGSAALSIAGIVAGGSFAQTNNCPASLAAGTTCTINVSFKPTTSTTITGALKVTDNGVSSPQEIPISGTGTGTAATLSISPSQLTFANQNVGTTSAAQTATVTNTGQVTINFTSITVSGNDPNDFAQTNTCGSSLAVGAHCTISATFTPTTTGNRIAGVFLTDNASGSPQSLVLSGTGVSSGTPVVSLTPTSLTFSTQAIGTASTAKMVAVKNTGTASLSISAISITGTNAGDFTQTHTCGSSLAAGASCSVSITFKPTASGSRTASLSISDNASGSPQKVSISGTGTTAKLSPTSVNFGTVVIGVTSGAKTVTLTNVGTTALTITSISITGTNAADFSQTHTCTSSLAAAASCTISVKFKPTASGARTAVLSIADNAAGSPQTVPLTGTGTTAKLSPTSLSFGTITVGTSSAAKTITLTNVGTTSLSISSIAITGTNAGDFSQTHTCGSSLAPAASCTINVTFKPTVSGARSALLAVTDNAAGSPQKVTLSGSGS
jgi:hypothetical protein